MRQSLGKKQNDNEMKKTLILSYYKKLMGSKVAELIRQYQM